MKQYIYTPAEAGLGHQYWPSGELRLNGEIVTDPNNADVFVVPGALHMFKAAWELDRFKYMKGNESRHVFFHCSDDEVRYGKQCMFIRCNTRPWNLVDDPNTISWPWPVEDYAECLEVPTDGFKYDVSFQGWNWSDVRKIATSVCRASNLKLDFATYNDFFGYLDNPNHPNYNMAELVRRRAEFRRSMRESRVALCPESIPGVFPYRFFEAMSAGCVPVLIGSDFVFPFADDIYYPLFTIYVSRENARFTAEIISQHLAKRSDDELIEMGRVARKYWEKYLDSRRWPELMTCAVERKLKLEVSCH
jgi:hypothetical protein